MHLQPSVRPSRRRRGWLAGAACAFAFAVPVTAAHAAPLSLVDTAEPIGPGIELRHQKLLAATGWVDRQVLTADLSNPAVSSDLLTSDKVAQGGPLTVAANKAGAVAGINGDFFDIGNSGAALGFEIKSGLLRKSGSRNSGQSFGVTKAGIGQLANIALAATVDFGGQQRPLSGLNEVGVAAGKIGAYTSEWGAYSRANMVGGSSNATEVWVADGKVVRAAAAPAGGTLPDGTTALVGREAGADALKTLQVGDPVAIAYGLNPELASQFQFAVGTDAQLVRDGAQVPDAEANAGASGASIAPRTAIGFKNGGKTLIMLTVDGPGGTGKGGSTLPQVAKMMADLGAETAVNLDGGGSTTMVARGLGDPLATVRNVPSDGNERSDPNGVGVFVRPGNDKVEDLVVTPSDDEARVFPGLHRTLTAKAVDDHQVPVALARGDVRWSASSGSVDGGLLAAPADARGTIEVRSTADTAQAETPVRVLGKLRTLELSSARISIADATAGSATSVRVTGRDSQGFTAPIEAADLDLDYDRSILKIAPSGTGLKITPLKTGGTLLKVRAGGQEAKLPVSVGVQTDPVYAFDAADEVAQWTTNGTTGTTKTLSQDPDGLRLTYAAARNMGITKAPVETRPAVPGQPLRIRARVYSDGELEFGSLYWIDSSGASKNLLTAGPKTAGWFNFEWTLPADTKFPIKLNQLQVIQTATAKQRNGYVVFNKVEADNAAEVEIPAQEPLRPDPLFSPDGRTNGKDDWAFSTLSDVQFTASVPELAKVGVAALERIRATKPDLIVLNGDITDLGAAADLTLARQTLETGGCQLIPLTTTIGRDDTPAPTADKTPCYYVPGNHESYRAAGQGDLAPFNAEFGPSYGTFDHKGTRFILLNSALGSLRGSDFAQLPMFQAALDSAVSDPNVDNVMVFAHHPVDDPEATKQSQLGDRTEVQLIEKLLTDFREKSDKGASMVGSHAQVADVHRVEGVPYTVLPSSGKAPYGVPDRGGFTGWLNWSVDQDAKADEQWLTADVRAFAQSITLNAPASIEVSSSTPLSGSIVQPSGVQNGTRIVPLAYPMSVRWSGSESLAIGSGEAAIDAARQAGKVAILDPVTRALTGLRKGSVTVKVTNDSMREYTGPASLAPITTEKTIEVTPWTGDGPRFVANTPVFTAQPTGTVSVGQWVTVTNPGNAPLKIERVAVRPGDEASTGDFLTSSNGCADTTVAPNGSCRVLVRFAPSRVRATSTAQLVFTTNTADREQTVALSGQSVDLPKGEQGEQGAPGAAGPAGANGAKGDAGSNGAAGPTGNAGATGNPGATGVPGAAGAPGAKGEAGAKGDRGEAGRDAKVTCKVARSGRRQRVACTVTTGKSKSKAATKAKARLTRGGRTYARGTVARITVSRKLTAGRYTVRIGSGRTAITQAIRIR